MISDISMRGDVFPGYIPSGTSLYPKGLKRTQKDPKGTQKDPKGTKRTL